MNHGVSQGHDTVYTTADESSHSLIPYFLKSILQYTAAFLKISAVADHLIGSRHTGGPPS
jgi:hypothetical protein